MNCQILGCSGCESNAAKYTNWQTLGCSGCESNAETYKLPVPWLQKSYRINYTRTGAQWVSVCENCIELYTDSGVASHTELIMHGQGDWSLIEIYT